jgi:hypothetical protein
MRVQGPSGDSYETLRGTAARRAKCPGRSRSLHVDGRAQNWLVRPVQIAEGHPPVPLVVVKRHGGEIFVVRKPILGLSRTATVGKTVTLLVLAQEGWFWAVGPNFWGFYRDKDKFESVFSHPFLEPPCLERLNLWEFYYLVCLDCRQY